METFKKLHNRVIDISYKHSLSHLSSCITTLPILFEIFSEKEKNDIVILSNGHAGLAQYVCMEHFEGEDAEILFGKYGVHPERSGDDSIFCTTGSLGLGLPIAIGAAMASNNTVHCVISDGECCEGSIWESLYYLSKKPLDNLKIYVNINGFSAYDTIDKSHLENVLKSFNVKNIKIMDTQDHINRFSFLKDKHIESHYCKITSDDVCRQLKYEI